MGLSIRGQTQQHIREDIHDDEVIRCAISNARMREAIGLQTGEHLREAIGAGILGANIDGAFGDICGNNGARKMLGDGETGDAGTRADIERAGGRKQRRVDGSDKLDHPTRGLVLPIAERVRTGAEVELSQRLRLRFVDHERVFPVTLRGCFRILGHAVLEEVGMLHAVEHVIQPRQRVLLDLVHRLQAKLA